MQRKSIITDLPQPPLFSLEESTGKIELFPAVWSAAEQLIHPEADVRRNGIQQLVDLQAPRFSSLVAYLLATRLTDPDLSVRGQVVRVLGEVLMPDSKGNPAPEEVRYKLTDYLSQMHTRETYSLLQVLADQPELESYVTQLFDACPFASNHLVDILVDRSTALEIRIHAAEEIGKVGYLEALPQLERLEARLESRMNGQRAMSFISVAKSEEHELLPAIHRALVLLRAP